MNVPHLPADHPWYFLNRYGTPNVKWCEATVHGWITEPANTWSNIFFFIVLYLMFRESRRQPNAQSSLWLPATAILGFGSGIYHASSTLVFQILDFFGMFLVFLIPLFVNFKRLGWASLVSRKKYWLTSILATAVIPFIVHTEFPIQALIGSVALSVIFSEFVLWQRGPRQGLTYSSFFVCAALLATAGMFSAADVSGLYCDPDNHFIQGHAIWHFFSSSAIYFGYKHYRQFESY